MIRSIRCRQCGTRITYNPNKFESCHCDPDCTSWVAIGKDGRVVKMSGANIEILDETQE